MDEKNTNHSNTEHPFKQTDEKRYGFLLLAILVSWTIVGLMVWFVEPEKIKNFLVPGIYLPMLIVIFLGIFFLLSALLMSAKKALRWTAGAILFLLLRIMGQGSLLNGILILGVLTCLEFYIKEN